MKIGAANRDRRSFVQAVAVSALLVAADAAAGASPSAPLELRVSAPAALIASQSHDISVVITNIGTTRVRVLPNLVRLRIEGHGAQYVPYPGPPVDPWGDARELAPGETATVAFISASDRRGIWRLPPGNYQIIAVYDVPSDLAPPATIADPDRVWRGKLQSLPASSRVN